MHSHQLVGNVDALLDHPSRLLDEFGVNHRQKRGIIADIVFHNQQDRHTHGLRVMQDIALVFDVFDDRDQDAGIPLPQENPFDMSDWIACDEIFYFPVIVGQHYYRDIQTRASDLGSQLGGVHITDREIGDNQIELRLRSRQG